MSWLTNPLDRDNFFAIKKKISYGYKVVVILRGEKVDEINKLRNALLENVGNADESSNKIEENCSPIIIISLYYDREELKRYCCQAVKYNYILEILEPESVWYGYKITRESRDIWSYINEERYITTADLLQLFELTYQQRVPEFREWPPIPELNDYESIWEEIVTRNSIRNNYDPWTCKNWKDNEYKQKLGRIKKYIKYGYKIIVILRGNKREEIYNLKMFLLEAADEFDGSITSTYNYMNKMKGNYSPIIIISSDRMSTDSLETICYDAVKYNYMVEILQPQNIWSSNLNTYATTVTKADLLLRYKLIYKQELPELRHRPTVVNFQDSESVQDEIKVRSFILNDYSPWLSIDIKVLSWLECTEDKQNFLQVKNYIRYGYKVMVILRGNKQQEIRQLRMSLLENTFGMEVNDFNGDHRCGKQFISKVEEGYSPIIVTSSDYDGNRLRNYCSNSVRNNYMIEILEPKNIWSSEENYKISMTRMELFQLYMLTYREDIPQFRKYPLIQKLDNENMKSNENIARNVVKTNYNQWVRKEAKRGTNVNKTSQIVTNTFKSKSTSGGIEIKDSLEEIRKQLIQNSELVANVKKNVNGMKILIEQNQDLLKDYIDKRIKENLEDIMDAKLASCKDEISVSLESSNKKILNDKDRIPELFHSFKAEIKTLMEHANIKMMKPMTTPFNKDNINASTLSDEVNDIQVISEHTGSDSKYNRILNLIKHGYKIMILLRGLPGSGKSYLADSLLSDSFDNVDKSKFIFNINDYFIKAKHDVTDSHTLKESHQWNQSSCSDSMKRGVSPIIIDNTNLKIHHMKGYCKMAAKYSYIVEILQPKTSWAFNVNELAKRNSTGIGKGKIEELLKGFQLNVTAANLFKEFGLEYNVEYPQLRLYPLLKTCNPNIIIESDDQTN